MNRFIEAEQKINDKDDPQFFVFVDSMDKDYNDNPGNVIKEATFPDSPFIGKTTEECFALLKELQGTTKSSIDLQAFAIMDDRSNDDDTVLIVNADDGCASVRAEFAIAIPAMMCWMTGHSDVEDNIYTARKTEDNVLRWGPR